TELRRLQQRGGYEQLLLTDATQLKQLLDYRIGPGYRSNERPSRSDEPDLRHFDPASYQRGFLSALDQQIGNEFERLCLDAGVGSLLLALALGLLLSDSFVVPLRKTQKRLATIAAGDFSGHVEVPNRDEIGALAADVNRMSDELQRLYQELEAASRQKSDFL